MRVKKLLLMIVLFVFGLFLTGCMLTHKSITAEEFMSIAKENDYTVLDVYNNMKTYGIFKKALIAKRNDDYQIEFYVLNTETDAKDMFKDNKKKFEASKSGSSFQNNVAILNYSMYTLESGGYYMYISRIDNTVLYFISL